MTYERVLGAGFSGRLLWLYAREQEYLRRARGTAPHPAYLVLSDNQGGFPRVGFVLDGAELRDAGYVDLHRRQDLTGRFGAMDQIFPHELLHVMVQQLAGPPAAGGGNQVHALGVRTDPETAWQEGFAEAMQVLALDDPKAAGPTRALRSDAELQRWTEGRLLAFGRAVSARVALAPKAIMTFPLWFSRAEQVLRYHWVRGRPFGCSSIDASDLARRGRLHGAYLLTSVVPCYFAEGSPRERLAREGFVARFMWRVLTNPVLQASYRDAGFYAAFGTRPSEVRPLENMFLKIFHALAEHRPTDLAGFTDAYASTYPDEAAEIRALAEEVLGAVPVATPSLWVLSDRLTTGTTLFDMFQALPRAHTFDLNAASGVDLYSVRGMTPEAASRLGRGGPYRDLARIESLGLPADLVANIKAGVAAMERHRAAAVEEEASLGLRKILAPYLRRALGWWLACGVCGAFVFWRLRRLHPARALANGLACALIALLAAWLIDPTDGWLALATPFLLCGVPGALIDFARRRQARSAIRVSASWLAAALPSLVVVFPLF